RLFYAWGPFSDDVVSWTTTGFVYCYWAAEEWSGLKLQAPEQVIDGGTNFSPNHGSATTAAIATIPSLVVGIAQNDVNASPSEWSQPVDYSMGALNIQQYSAASSGCLVERVVEDSAAQTLLFTGDGTKNFGHVVAAVFAGLTPVPPTTDEGNPIMFGMNF